MPRCKICSKPYRPMKKQKNRVYWKKYQICPKCYCDIRGEVFVVTSTAYKKQVTKCDHCGKRLFSLSYGHGFCSGGHRSLYYRMRKQRIEAQNEWKYYEKIAKEYLESKGVEEKCLAPQAR